MSNPQVPFAQRIGSLSSQALYLFLVVATVIPLFLSYPLPSKAEDQSVDLYTNLMALPKDKPLMISSDWTNSSRGESAGQFEALMRILMRNEVKFFFFSIADPQAPQVARDVIRRINEERKAAGERPYEAWKDYVDAGFYSDPNFAMGAAMKADVRSAFANKKARRPDGSLGDIWQSDVLKDVRKLTDFSMLINITASSSIDFIISRLSGTIPLACMCTGVVGPGIQPYYASGQIVGLSIGLKGVYDIERMMEFGVVGSQKAGPKETRVVSKNSPDVEIKPYTGKLNLARGASYYLALHIALALIILAVVAGNVALISQKAGRAKK